MPALSVIILQPISPEFQGILEKAARDAQAPCELVADPASAARAAAAHPVQLIVIEARDSRAVARASALMKALGPMVASRRSRVIVLFGADHDSYERLTMQGCAEIIPANSNAKALQLKVDRHMRACAQEVVRLERNLAAKKAKEAAKEAAAKDAKAAGDVADGKAKRRAGKMHRAVLKDAPALAIAADFWLFFDGSGKEEEVGTAKFSGGRWSLRIKGPSPKLGKWVRGEERDGITSWIWEMTDPELVGMPGQWVFRGFRPEYHMELWSFVGGSPSLRFMHEDQSLGSRFDVDDLGNLLMAADSAGAREKFAKLRKLAQHVEAVTEEKKSEAPAPAVRRPIDWMPPLELKSDCWRLCEDPVFRGQWHLKFYGPTPHHGSWKAEGEQGPWRWTPSDPSDKHIVEEGAWVFRGEKAPHFEDGHWAFHGLQTELFFEYQHESYGSRFIGTADSLRVTEDRDHTVTDSKAVAEAERAEDEAESRAAEAAAANAKKQRKPDDATVAAADAPPESPETEGASWEHAGVDEEGNRVFVCVTEAVTHGAVTSLEQVGSVFVYKGQTAPTLKRKNGKSFWHFEGEAPKRHDNIFEVPKPVREHLASRLMKEAGGGAKDDNEIDYKSEHKQGKLLEAVQEGPGKGKLMEAVQKGAGPGELLEAVQEGAGPGKELEAVQKGAGPGKMLESKQAAPTNNPELALDLMQVATQPLQQGLSPIAFAFIVSELVGQAGGAREKTIERFISYVAQSTGAEHVELWGADGKRASTKSLDAASEKALRAVLAQAAAAGVAARAPAAAKTTRALWLCPVRAATGPEGAPLGFVALASGEDGELSEKLLKVVGRTAVAFLAA